MKMKVMGINIMPIMVMMMNWMPEGMRRSTVTKQNAPKPKKKIKDLYDLNGTTPYKTEEIVPGKLWEITYTFENSARFDKDAKNEMKAFGMDYSSETCIKKILEGAASHGENVVETAIKDIQIALEWAEKKSFTDTEMLEAYGNKLKTFVVKLNNGNLLLYAPVQIRDEVGFGTWIESLGKVEWIVVASCYHTLHLQNVLERFPEAKIIGTPASEAKLNHINALTRKQYEVNCQDESQLSALNSVLEKEGAKLFYIAGDVATNAVVLMAHGIALECDLIYAHHDGGFFNLSKDVVKQNKHEHWELRIFKHLLISKPNSPNGMLANYRFQMMDPTGLGAMSYDQPKKDGSSCSTMAESLRTMLKADFELAAGVHIEQTIPDDFRKTIDANWNWLDGKSLLPS